uniref:Uncharacterized protein n=1 Tax=Lactuca sativa TaxID=4236 RepID=A0A9R1X8R2_LACSA|nr:hypothetical protein LSAT_V11C500287830 [Lactuca sativa]
MQRAIGMCINGEDSVQKRKWTDGFSLPVLFHHLFLNFRILRMLPPETMVGPFKPNLIWKPTSPKWGSRNSKLLSFHTPVAEAMCATDAKPQLMISSEPSVTEDELKLMLRMCWEILFKNLDLDMKDRVRKIEGNPDFCCFISTKYCKSRMLPMVMDKARIRNSEYSGLNNASESLKHAMQLVIGICIN